MFLLHAVPAVGEVADAVPRAALERCSALDTDGAKLACYEALASSDAALSGSVPVVAPPPDKESVNTPAPVETAATSTRAPDAAAELAEPAALPDALGREHLQREAADDAPETLTALVRRAERRGNRLLYFEFDNGQVWRQMESGYVPYPRDRAFEVTIRQGVMGDYQLRVEDRGRMIRIVRVK